MNSEGNRSALGDKSIAAACGLYCEACTLYIATMEDPERLTKLAARLQVPEEAARCHGCRSDKRFPQCDACKMSACTARRGIDFCSECSEYPCPELKEFQGQRPHRLELWDDLERIREIGCGRWLGEVRKRYVCPECGTVNSAYDLKCRECGKEPSCAYVEAHGEEIRRFLAKL